MLILRSYNFNGFNRLMDYTKHKTLIMVTHRKVGLARMDVIYQMQQGVLVKSHSS
jgi:ABC-type transport system involved in cytochrome bd biosynthesis fused ATPase/permease subunit